MSRHLSLLAPRQDADDVIDTPFPLVPTWEPGAPVHGRRGLYTRTIGIYPTGGDQGLEPVVALRADALVQCILSVTFGDDVMGSTALQGSGWVVENNKDIVDSNFRVEIMQVNRIAAAVSRAPYLNFINVEQGGFAVFRVAQGSLPSVVDVKQLYKRSVGRPHNVRYLIMSRLFEPHLVASPLCLVRNTA